MHREQKLCCQQGRSDQRPPWGAADRDSLVEWFAHKRYRRRLSDLASRQEHRRGHGVAADLAFYVLVHLLQALRDATSFVEFC
jgi:hypothetical protein